MTRSEQFNQLIAEYLEAQRKNQAPSRGQMIARHPSFEDEWNSFFDNHEALVGQVPIADPAATLAPDALVDAAGSEQLVRYFGDYELLEEIARGGMGVVFRARQVSLNRIVALKMILAGQFASPTEVQRFRMEAEAAANLDHPNILPIYEVGEHEGQQYFSMKFVDGGSLAKVRSREPQISVPRMVEILTQVARAVHFAHQRGILHRDLKPGNILLDADATPFVADFGLAKRIESDSKQTQTGAIVGTPSYMAPEQARSEKTLTTAVDVYALGAILYEIITGQPPFAGPTPVDVLMQVLENEPPHPQKTNPRVDPDLATIAMKCLEKAPVKRYPSATALADDLERWSRGEPIAARPVSPQQRISKWIRRNKTAAALIAVSVIAAIGIPTMMVREQIVTQAALREKTQAVDDLNANLDRQKKLIGILRVGQVERALDKGDLIEAQRCLHLTEPDQRFWEWNWLARRVLPDIRVVPLPNRANDDFASRLLTMGWQPRLSLSRCGRFCAVGFDKQTSLHRNNNDIGKLSRSSPVKIYDLTRNEVVCTLPDALEVGQFSPDGRQLAALSFISPSSHETQATIWNLHDGQPVHRFGPVNAIYPVQGFIPNGKAIVYHNGTLKTNGDTVLHELATGQELKLHPWRFDHIRVSTDSRWALVNRNDEPGFLIDLDNPSAPQPLADVLKKSNGVGFAAAAGVVVAEFVSEPGKNREFDGYLNFVTRSMDGAIKSTVRGPMCSKYEQPQFTPCGRFARMRASAINDQSRTIWYDVATGQSVLNFVGGQMRFEQVQFSARLDRVAWLDGDIRQPIVWNVLGNQPVRALSWPALGTHGQRKPFDLDADGRWLALQWIQSFRQIRDTRFGDLLWQSPSSSASGFFIGTAISPDGRLIVGRDYISRPQTKNALELIDPKTNSIHATIATDVWSGEFTVEGFSPDGAMLAVADSSRWTVFSSSGQRLFGTEYNSNIECVAFSRDSQFMALGGGQIRLQDSRDHPADGPGQIVILRTDDWSLVQTLNSDHAATGIAFAPDGQRLAVVRGMPQKRSGWSGDKPNLVEIWDWKTNQRVAAMAGHTQHVDQVAWSADGRRVFTMSQDGTMRIWDPDLAESVLAVPVPGAKSPDNTILRVFMTLSGNGQMLALGAKNQVHLWNGAPLPVLPDPIGDPYRRPVSHHIEWANGWSAERLVSSTERQPIQQWVFNAPRDIGLFLLSPDDSLLVAESNAQQSLKVWEVATGQAVQTLSDLPPQMIRFAISPDSRRVAVAGGSRKTRKYVGMEKNQLKYEDVGEDKPGIISVRDLRTGQEISSFRGHTSPISFVKFLDDKRVCSKSADEKFSRVWDLESGSELQQLKPEFASIPGTKLGWCYAPDAEGKPTKKVALRDAESGEIVRQFESLPNFPRTVNSDRSVAVVATQQYKANDPNPLTVTVSLWDLQSDKLLHELSQSSQVLGAAQFRSAGQLVTVIGETVTIWDVATGQPLERRRIDDGGSFSADAVLSRDGQRILFRVAEPNRHALQYWNIADLPMVRSPDTW